MFECTVRFIISLFELNFVFLFFFSSWYSWIIRSLVNGKLIVIRFLSHPTEKGRLSVLTLALFFYLSVSGVYAFGFLFMLPQLFVNYKVGFNNRGHCSGKIT